MPAKLDEKTVRHVAELARLRITEKEVTQYARQLAAILDYVAQINEPDLTGVAPTAHAVDLHNVFRDDDPHTPWDADTALRNAPQRRDGFFEVPKVLGQDSA